MRKFLCLLALAIPCGVTAAAPYPQKGFEWEALPLEYLAYESKLIVIAKIAEVEQPQAVTLEHPVYRLGKGPQQYRLVRHKVEVTGILKGVNKVLPSNRLEILCERGDLLKVGKSYVLILLKIKGRSEYYLRINPGVRLEATTEAIKKVRTAIDVNSWPWGKAKAGLQIVMLTTPKPALIEPGPKVYVNVFFALRNTSEKTMTVCLYSGDKYLAIEATGPDGKTIRPDLYAGQSNPRPIGPDNLHAVKPGQLLFISRHNLSRYRELLILPLTTGKWTLKAVYELRREGKGHGWQWVGKIESKPVEVEVRKLTAKEIKEFEEEQKRREEQRERAEAEKARMEEQKRRAQEQAERELQGKRR